MKKTQSLPPRNSQSSVYRALVDCDKYPNGNKEYNRGRVIPGDIWDGEIGSVIPGDIWDGFLEEMSTFKGRTLTIRDTSAQSRVLEEGTGVSSALPLLGKHWAWGMAAPATCCSGRWLLATSSLCLVAFATTVAWEVSRDGSSGPLLRVGIPRNAS